MYRSFLSFVAAAVLLFAEGAAAHDVWLDVAPYEAGSRIVQVGQRADVRLLVGHGVQDPETVARNERLIVEFVARSPDGEDVPVPGLHGMDPAGVFRADRAGLWSVRYIGRAVEHRLEAEAFESYLMEEGLDQILEARRQSGDSSTPGRELFSRSLEALVPVDGGSSASWRWSAVPSQDQPSLDLPVRFRLRSLEDRVEVQLLAGGEPVADALVDLRRDGLPAGTRRTGDDGRFSLSRRDLKPGIWVVTAVVMTPIDDPRADWRTIFAALTFPWPGADGRGGRSSR